MTKRSREKLIDQLADDIMRHPEGPTAATKGILEDLLQAMGTAADASESIGVSTFAAECRSLHAQTAEFAEGMKP